MNPQTDPKYVVVFDALDTIQGYKDAPLGGSKLFYQQHFARELGISVERFNADYSYLIHLEMTMRALEKGDLEPVMLPGAKEMIAYVRTQPQYLKHPIVVTADIPEAAALALKPFTDAGVFQADEIYATARLGDKKTPELWKKVKEMYFPQGKIWGVFEDTEKNLEAACEAYGLRSSFLVKHAEDTVRQGWPILRGNFGFIIGELELSVPWG